jgi:hypothetical protein
MTPFDDDVVKSIAQYMNSNQPEINLQIVQVHGNLVRATAAELVDVGGATVEFRATVDGETQSVVIPWARPITRREHIRRELMELYETAGEA